MVSNVALRRGARLERKDGKHVPLDDASRAIVQQVGQDLADWLGYASVDEMRADSIGGRYRRLRDVKP